MKQFVNENPRSSFRRSLRSMKLLVLLVVCCFGTLSASTYYSQNTLLSLSANNMTIKEVFSKIESQSEYIFFYNDEALDLNKRVNVSMEGATIYTILDDVLDKSTTGYKINDRQVIVYRNETQKSVAAPVSVAAVMQQSNDRTVTGRVTDAQGQPLLAVAVTQKGTTRGVTTDMDGRYSINVTGGEAVLVFNYIGYGTLERPVGAATVVNVQMESISEDIDEVVVVAYGTQRKSSITGSITSLKEDQLKTVTSPNVGSMLAGKVAGVSATMSSGRPDGGDGTTIRIRGNNSLGTDQSPLWVVDGVIDGLSGQINPNDIESMTILKDASATALYGSRGANGVIIVTTKSGRTGTNRIDVGVKLGFTQLHRGNLEMMNSQELYDYTKMAFENTLAETPDWFTPRLTENDTDWWKYATQTALSQNYNVNYTMGSDKVKAFVSGDYYNEDGTLKGYSYEKFTVRSNVDYKYNDRLTIKTKVSANYNNTLDQSHSMGSTYLYMPWDTPYNSNGFLKTGKEGTTHDDPRDNWYGRDLNNYLYNVGRYSWSKTKSFGINGTFGFDLKFTDWLVFESTNNMTLTSSLNEQYSDPQSSTDGEDNGWLYNSSSETRRRYTNQLLRFNYMFGDKHAVDAFLGYEYYDYYYHNHNGQGKGLVSGAEILNVVAKEFKVGGNKVMNKAVAYYFNGNYTFDQRLMFQFSFRRDGSSRFGRDNQFGNFYTIGGGWNIHNEKFLQDATFINQLKLRVSYGTTGNTPSNSYTHMSLYQLNMNYNGQPTMFPFQYGNRNLGWEKTVTTNVGLDARLWDRLGITIDFYNKNTSDLLYPVNLPTISGFSSQYRNVGALYNRGIEVTLSPDIIKNQDWYWAMDLNFNYNKNKVTELYEGNQQISGNTITKEGNAIKDWYLHEWAGVDPDTGDPLWYTTDHNGKRVTTTKYSEAERAVMGRRAPKITGGIMSNLRWKDLTLNVTTSFAFGHKIYHSGRENYDNDGLEIQYNTMRLHKGWKRWEKPGDIASHPKVIWGGNNDAAKPSSRFLEDGDYFKIRSISLSYNLPQKWVDKMHLGSMSVYVSGENLWTFTKFSGIDPEVSTGDTNSGNYSTSTYPIPRRISFGVNFSF